MKVLVYAKTIREARKAYIAQPGESVGARTFEEYDNGEEYDDRIVVGDLPKKSKKKAVTEDDL